MMRGRYQQSTAASSKIFCPALKSDTVLSAAAISLARNRYVFNGRGERIRTSDPLLPKQVLYQAEPLPEQCVRNAGW